MMTFGMTMIIINIKPRKGEYKMYAIIIISIIVLLFVFIYNARAENIPINNETIVPLTIAYEASNQPFSGQMAVARVIQNRAKERNETHVDICFEPHQFSCWSQGKPTQSRKITEAEYDKAEQAWFKAPFATEAEWYTANIYMRKELMPKWLDRGLKKGTVKFLCTVGVHNFFREVR